MRMRAGRLLVETLKAGGADRAFCVPGESFLGALDAFADDDSIEMVSCRHEGGAGFMALADAKLTGRPGLLFVSRGPGASNATIAVHTAEQDAAPLLVFVGQVPRKMRGQRAYQEVDFGKTYSDMAKWVVEIDDPSRISDLVGRAWHCALAGRPGPVVISLPEDMLLEHVNAPLMIPRTPSPAGPSDEHIRAAAALIASAQRPLLIAGAQLGRDARNLLSRVADQWQVPVVAAHKQQDIFPNDHPNWAGHLGYIVPRDQSAAWAAADLILALGTPLGDVDSQNYTLPRGPVPAQPLIHVYPEAAEVGRVFQPALSAVCDAREWLGALATQQAPVPSGARAEWAAYLHGVNANLRNAAVVDAGTGDETVSLDEVVREVSRQAAGNAVFTLDSGSFASAVHRQIEMVSQRAILGCVSGAMGGGVPSAVAAALRYPERQVICFVGDGGALMTGNELATAVQYGARITIVVANNRRYGAIHTHQARLFPGREVATKLANPDFAAWAEAFGARGLKIRQATIAPTIRTALQSNVSAVIEVAVK